MSDYISREAVLDLCDKLGSLGYFQEYLKRIPTADVVEVKRGKWERIYELSDVIGSHFCCSACGKPRYEHYACNSFNYCPDCGADMRGDKR